MHLMQQIQFLKTGHPCTVGSETTLWECGLRLLDPTVFVWSWSKIPSTSLSSSYSCFHFSWGPVADVNVAIRKIATLLKPDKDISHDGDHIVIKTLSTFKNYNMDFYVGKEFEEDLSGVDDRKCMVSNLDWGRELIHFYECIHATLQCLPIWKTCWTICYIITSQSRECEHLWHYYISYGCRAQCV